MSGSSKKSGISGGIRARLRQLRFEWLKRQLQQPEDSYSLFELGCFNCRSLNYVPKPKHYLGADAGWEGGLNDAQMTFVRKPWVELVMARTAHELAPFQYRRFDYTIALETLEHIPDPILKGYLEFIAKATRKQFLVTVPVEVGAVFLAKHLLRLCVSGLSDAESHSFTLMEVCWATLGRTDRVKRYEHKGFDYRKLMDTLSEYFEIERVEGIPFKRVPMLSPQVGIILRPKSNNS